MSREPFDRSEFFDDSEFSVDKAERAAKGAAKDIRNKIVDATSRIKDQAGEMAAKFSDTVDKQRDSAASGLESAASTLDHRASEIPGGPQVQNIAHSIAGGMESLAGYVRDANLDDIKKTALETCKKYPAQTLISALLVGFLVGRAIRR